MSSADSLQSGPRPFDEENEYEDAEKNFQPRSPSFWMIVIGMYAFIFLVALDRMIIATAIPGITNAFHSIEDIGWYGSAYMLTAAIFNPLFGRIYQLHVFILTAALSACMILGAGIVQWKSTKGNKSHPSKTDEASKEGKSEANEGKSEAK